MNRKVPVMDTRTCLRRIRFRKDGLVMDRVKVGVLPWSQATTDRVSSKWVVEARPGAGSKSSLATKPVGTVRESVTLA